MMEITNIYGGDIDLNNERDCLYNMIQINEHLNYEKGIRMHHSKTQIFLKRKIWGIIDDAHPCKKVCKKDIDFVIIMLNKIKTLNILELEPYSNYSVYDRECTYSYLLKNKRSDIYEKLDIPKTWVELQRERKKLSIPYVRNF